jgi:flagellar biosynthetic protein FliQ
VNSDVAVSLTVHTVMLGLKLALPFLGASLIVGLGVSILQAATQIQEMTLTFVPKIVVTLIVLVVAGPWMLDELTTYTHELFLQIPALTAP